MSSTTPTQVIDGVAVFDGTGSPVSAAQAIVVDGGRIAWIGPAARLPEQWRGVPDRIDGTGLTAIPGLFDCHTHLTFDADPASFVTVQASPVQLTLIALANLSAQLDSGVTTVRDCGSYDRIAIDLAKAVAAGTVEGPRVLAAGLVLTMTGGHGHFIGNLVDGVDSATKAARTEIAAGADFIKVMATGGVLTKGVSTGQVGLRRPEIEAIVHAAHDSGKRVTAHATGLRGAANAIEAGVDSLEHGMELSEDVAGLAAERGTILVPTLSAISGLSHNQESLPGWMADKIDDAVDNLTRSFALATRSGIRIAAGTDAGTPYNAHGGLPGEIELLTDYGISPADAVIAATRSSAVNLGLEAELGTLEPGKLADLVLLGSDPTVDIRAVRDVRLVMKEGEIVRRFGTAAGA